MNFSITDRFRLARAADRKRYVEQEKEKIGNLRAGSTGVMNAEGEIAGACHRKSHLRQMGIEIDPPTTDKLIMFSLGYANEEQILKELKLSLAPDEVILCEEEIPIEWRTSNNTKVTGRPDMVICRINSSVFIPENSETNVSTTRDSTSFISYTGPAPITAANVTPLLGLELKSIHSMWTARDVFFSGAPKMDNLIQAAHYMWKLDVPYKIVYRSYSQLGQGMSDGADWIRSMLPAPGDYLSEYLEYSYYELVTKDVLNRKTGQYSSKEVRSKITKETYEGLYPSKRAYSIKHIKQFEAVYDLQFSTDGILQYRLEGESTWTPTVVHKDDIARYFEFVSWMGTGGGLGPRPLTIKADGSKLNYSNCSYCPLQSTCDKADKDKGEDKYQHWLADVIDITRANAKRDTK